MIVSLIEFALLTRFQFWLVLSMDTCCSRFLFKPAEIIHSTKELTQELEELKTEADTVVTKQKEVRDKIDKELNTVCKKIMDLQKRVGSDPDVESVARTILKNHNVTSQE